MTWSRISRRQLPTQRSAMPFCQGAWTLVRLGFRPVAFRNVITASVELRIAIQDGVAVRARFGERLAQLLDDPLRSRVAGHVEVQDPAASVLDDEEAVQQLEGHRRHGEEVEGDDHLAMILEKRKPAFARVAAAPNPSQIAGHGPFRDDEAELLQFSVDLGGSPVRVLFGQATDQTPDLLGDLRPAAARPGSPTPVETKTGAVPADDGLGLDDDEDVGPAGPEAAEGGPEESVQGVQYWPRPLAFEHGDLLSEGEDFEGGIASTAKEDRTPAMKERMNSSTNSPL